MSKILKTGYLIIILLFLYLPIATLMVFSFNESKSMSIWTGFSFKWYGEMFNNSMIMEAIWNTFSIALVAAIVSTIIGTVACIGINSMRKRTEAVIMGLNNIPLLNADIVTGISLMMAFLAFGITLSWGTVLLAHITFCIPYVILSVLPKFKQLPGNTYEAALDLGATPIYAFFKVILPEIRPGIVSGFLLAFTMSVDDFVITHFTRGAGINTISTLIYSQVKVGIRPTLFALSTIIFIVVMVILVISNIITARGEKK
ncbi:spermidine/putrescine transport system permease protein [Clostridiales Family XIII bacterium PM5-7]